MPQVGRPGFSTGAWESLSIALESLRANKLRTFLTMLGIIIGVWSVVSLLAIGNGAQQAIIEQVEGIGTNLLNVVPGTRDQGPNAGAGIKPLTLADADAIERAVTEIEYVAPIFQGAAQIIGGDVSRGVQVTGATPEVAPVRNFELERGQFINQQMQEGGRNVAVLGNQIAEDIFGSSEPIGQRIKLNNRSFTVVGVLASSGGLANEDTSVYVPLSTAYRTLFSGRTTTSSSLEVSGILLQVRSNDEIELAQEKVEQLMRRRRDVPNDGNDDDFIVFSQESLLDIFGTITTTLTVFLGSIAGISLLVGGIGVMNIMLVSVSERTKEIGLRKAVGAKRRDILRQFLIEALVISILGGIIGLALAWAMSTAIGYFFSEYITPLLRRALLFWRSGFRQRSACFSAFTPLSVPRGLIQFKHYATSSRAFQYG
jgi:putative ABC transport system permease protein